jgi:hypothetical protein
MKRVILGSQNLVAKRIHFKNRALKGGEPPPPEREPPPPEPTPPPLDKPPEFEIPQSRRSLEMAGLDTGLLSAG